MRATPMATLTPGNAGRARNLTVHKQGNQNSAFQSAETNWYFRCTPIWQQLQGSGSIPDILCLCYIINEIKRLVVLGNKNNIYFTSIEDGHGLQS